MKSFIRLSSPAGGQGAAPMDINVTDEELDILKKVGAAAAALHVPCYLIGGFVRDKILGRRTKDADFVCVGDALQLAGKVAAGFNPQPAVAYFKNFGTAQLKLAAGFELEFVGARQESYRSHSRK